MDTKTFQSRGQSGNHFKNSLAETVPWMKTHNDPNQRKSLPTNGERDYFLDKETAKLGIAVSKEEMNDMVYGENVSPLLSNFHIFGRKQTIQQTKSSRILEIYQHRQRIEP